MKTTMFTLILTVVLLSQWNVAAEDKSPAVTDSQRSQIDSFVMKKKAEFDIPGIAVAVCRDGKLIYSKGYGTANIAKNTPVTAGTPFQLASVTKQFTAAAIMLLVQDGKLQLSDSVRKYLKQAPLAWKDITIEHLLTHTSGIHEYLNSPQMANYVPGQSSFEGLLAEMAVDFEPGTKHKYCNTGYVLLGIIIKRVTGKTYDRFLSERVFQRLGMKSTYLRDIRDPRLAVGYEGKSTESGWKPARQLIPEVWDNADGGLVSTVEDMAKWSNALDAQQILTKASLDRMWTRLKTKDKRIYDYGFAWVINIVGQHRVIGHAGGRPGVASNFTRWPDDGIAVIVLYNRSVSGGNDAYSIGSGVARILEPSIP